LKIERVTTELVRLQPPRPIASAGARVSSLDYVLVHLETTGGLTGLGYTCVYAGPEAGALRVLVDDLAELVRGQDARFRGRIWHQLRRAMASLGNSGMSTSVLSAYDLALWDIAGKAAGQPVYQLIGAVRDRFPIYYSGLFLNLDETDLVAEAEHARSEGFRYVKMRCGRPTIAEDVRRVRAVLDTLGDDVRLMVDCSRGFDAKRAIQLGRQLEPFNLVWIEEPTPPDDLAGSAQVTAALDTTVASGESAYTPHGIRALLEHRAADLIQPDLQRMGGLTGWLGAAALCATYGVPVSNHFFLDATAHALCASPAEPIGEYLPWPAPFENAAQILNGDLMMSGAPGLGLTRSASVAYLQTPAP
jgi:L-alanine-DL-glutamate epimerase-like enolase superfamily enzyme